MCPWMLWDGPPFPLWVLVSRMAAHALALPEICKSNLSDTSDHDHSIGRISMLMLRNAHQSCQEHTGDALQPRPSKSGRSQEAPEVLAR